MSDGSASSCDVEFQLRAGLINCLVWGAKGTGWESRTDADEQIMPSVARMAEIIKDQPASARPRIAVVCLEYGARVAAQQLHEAGVGTVIWLSGVDILSDRCGRLLVEVVLPAVQRVQSGEMADDTVKFINTELTKLCRSAVTETC